LGELEVFPAHISISHPLYCCFCFTKFILFELEFSMTVVHEGKRQRSQPKITTRPIYSTEDFWHSSYIDQVVDERKLRCTKTNQHAFFVFSFLSLSKTISSGTESNVGQSSMIAVEMMWAILNVIKVICYFNEDNETLQLRTCFCVLKSVYVLWLISLCCSFRNMFISSKHRSFSQSVVYNCVDQLKSWQYVTKNAISATSSGSSHERGERGTTRIHPCVPPWQPENVKRCFHSRECTCRSA